MDHNIPVRESGGVGYVVQGSECYCGWMLLWFKDICSLLHQAK